MDTSGLRSEFAGHVIAPGDSEYDAARVVSSGRIDKKPAVIIRVANADDIARAISLALATKLPLAVRSGGHSGLGHSTVEGGIVVDLRDMKKLTIDEQGKTVWAETGLTAIEVTRALDEHNFALGFGDTGSVGIGGITLGGGIGFLARKYGLAIDNLMAAEMVTADGKLVTVDVEHEPDLFWAIRGGGGNFGVVTRFKYQLHELGDVIGGMLLLPATPEIIAGFMEVTERAPDELSTIINIMPTPPMPMVPQEMVGKLCVMALVMYAGGSAQGEKVIAPLRALATPIADMIKPMRYKDIFFPDDPSYHPKAVSKTLFTKPIDRATAETVIQRLQSLDAPMRVVQLRVLGGAVSRIAVDETAYAHRDNLILGNIASFFETEEEKKTRQAWVDALATDLAESSAAYVGFLGPEEAGRVGDAYPDATRKRLAQIKRRYDPTNFFASNVNITPV